MAMAVRGLHYSPKAEADLEDIWLYTRQTWSSAQADRYITAIFKRLEQLAAGALSGQPYDHVRLGYFKLLVGSHIAFYRQTDTDIEVVRILHARMDFERHL